MSLNLGTILQASAADRPEHVAIRMDERVLTYAQLDRAARGVATSLRARGIQPGDRVALLIPNVPEFTIAYFGILYAGGTIVPINVLAAAPEVAYFLDDSEAKLLIAHPFFAAPAKAGADEAGVPLVLAGGGPGRTRSRRWRQRSRSRRSKPTPADAHRGDPLHVGHHRQAEGRRAHPLEPVRELRLRGAAPDPAAGPRRLRRARDAAALPLLRADRDPERDDRARRHLHAAAALRAEEVLTRSSSATASRSSPACRPCTSRCSTTSRSATTTSRACSSA